MKILLVDIPVGIVETNGIAEYLNNALQMHNNKIVKERLVERHHVSLPYGKSFTLGLLYLAAVLREEKHDVTYLISDDPNFIDDYFVALKEVEIILYSCKTNTYPQALRLATVAKDKKNDVVTIFGGPHPTALPNEVAKEKVVDIVSIGEGENTIRELIKYIETRQDISSVAGIAYWDQNKCDTVITPMRELCDLLAVPEPAYDLLPGGVSQYHIYVETGRGCLHNCSFCANPVLWKRQVRRFPPERVYNRLKKLSEDLPNNTLIHIVDPAFGFMDEDIELCKMLISHPLPLKFSCDMCAMNVTEDVINLLSKAGFVMFCVGIENCNSRVLKINHKPANINLIKKACSIIRNNSDALIKTYWIIGLPGEDQGTARDNRDAIIDMLRNGEFDICCEHIFVPYPGCDVFNNPIKYDYIIHHYDWEKYDARSFPLPGESHSFSMECAYIAFLDLLRAECELFGLQPLYDRNLVSENQNIMGFMSYKKSFI